MRKTSPQEILAFIDASRRLPNTAEKTIYVNFLVKQYELSCEARVIKGTVSQLCKEKNECQ